MNRPSEQIYSHYTPEDFLVWKTLFNRQMDILRTSVSVAYLDAINTIEFADNKIPDFKEVNHILTHTTGWKIEVVPNICPDARFFECSANRIFTSTCWLRTMEQLDYLEEPDMFHDVFGHMPLLTNHNYASFFSNFGKLALLYLDNPKAIQLLSRLYWYTIEFGLIREARDIKIYGAGIISSHGETRHAIDNATHILPFDVGVILDTPYRTDIIQDKYFVLDSFDQLYHSLSNIEHCLNQRI
jgi:phenylalanine-4-hydroxylase